LARVAEQAGYRSDAVFSKAFRRVTGQSPREWRKAAPPATAAGSAPPQPAAGPRRPAPRRSRRLGA
ncbi:MAG: Helix-turn-helix domain, partial [Burkholderiaceae bacterium]|nr:Helix-turn-helix domain [Burkholderiaceae bacterium]